MIINKSNILKNGNSTESFACINTCVLHKGFTLIELLVVMAIIAIISSILFSDYPAVRDRIAVTSAAHRLALALRESQAYGSAAGEVNGANTLGQAVRIVSSANLSANDNNYMLSFADNVDTSLSVVPGSDSSIKLSNMKYDTNEKIVDRSFEFEGGVRIDKIYVGDGSATSSDLGDGNILEIYFMRPESRARIYTSTYPASSDKSSQCSQTFNDDASIRRTRIPECYAGYKEADIQLVGAGSAGYKCVKVYYIGQITVKSGKCIE